MYLKESPCRTCEKKNHPKEIYSGKGDVKGGCMATCDKLKQIRLKMIEHGDSDTTSEDSFDESIISTIKID